MRGVLLGVRVGGRRGAFGGPVIVLGRVVAVSDNFLLRYQRFLGLESLRFCQPRNVVDLRLERRGVLGGEVRIVRVGF